MSHDEILTDDDVTPQFLSASHASGKGEDERLAYQAYASLGALLMEALLSQIVDDRDHDADVLELEPRDGRRRRREHRPRATGREPRVGQQVRPARPGSTFVQ